MASQFTRFESIDYTVWEYCERTGTKHPSLTTPLVNGCRNDDVTYLGSLCSQSLSQCIQISDAYIEHLLLQYSLHSVISWIQIWRILMPDL